MSSVRLRRLSADHAKLMDYVRRHPRVRLIQSEGDPPERYQFEYRINSLRMTNGELTPAPSHVVEIVLPRNYPRTPPQCRMLSPVFHPNIAPHAICVGDHWSAGESLQSIITRIGEMLAYQSYNVKSPLNGEAARWVEQHKHLVPLDKVSMLVEDDTFAGGAAPESATNSASASAQQHAAVSAHAPPPVSSGQAPSASVSAPAPVTPPAPPTMVSACPNCGKSFRIPIQLAGRKVRCTKCQHVFDVPSGESPAANSVAKKGST